MLNVRTLLYGLVFGLLDASSLPVVKNVSIGWSRWWLIVPVALYAISPFIFLSALKSGETLTIMNLVWDLTSDVIITIIGLVIYAEKLSPVKLLGVVFSFISLFLMTYEGNGWNTFLSQNFNKLLG
jgi:multidrug transporter EmrE-like cation transporter